MWFGARAKTLTSVQDGYARIPQHPPFHLCTHLLACQLQHKDAVVIVVRRESARANGCYVGVGVDRRAQRRRQRCRHGAHRCAAPLHRLERDAEAPTQRAGDGGGHDRLAGGAKYLRAGGGRVAHAAASISAYVHVLAQSRCGAEI
eukprot:6172651-Pleurochrysis_carterae.AAC.1